MKFMHKSLKMCSIALAAFGIIILIGSQREILTLISIGNTKAYLNPNWSYNSPADHIVISGKHIPATGCEDIKTDILIKVDIDGVTYYISDGSYILKREASSFYEKLFNSRATFSCVGLFLDEIHAIYPKNA